MYEEFRELHKLLNDNNIPHLATETDNVATLCYPVGLFGKDGAMVIRDIYNTRMLVIQMAYSDKPSKLALQTSGLFTPEEKAAGQCVRLLDADETYKRISEDWKKVNK